MSREFPDWIDPWKAADGRRSFQGTMPLKRLQRLAPLLATPADGAAGGVEWPDARFSAAFGRDQQGTVTVDLRVEADLPLVCQRSLEPYLEPVRRRSRLAVVRSAEEGDRLPEHYEPALAEHGRLALQDLVEDELLLGLPEVPRSPQSEAVRRSTDQPDPAEGGTTASPARGGESQGEGGDRAERTHRPFEGLADLLRDQDD